MADYWISTSGGTAFETGEAIALDSSGNIYVTGYTGSTGAGSNDVLLTKYDTSGTIQWQRVLGGASSDYCNGTAVDSSGNVYVGGYTNSQGAGSSDFLIAKYDTSGTLQWQRILGDADNQTGYNIAVDSSSNVYISGYSYDIPGVVNECFIAKYDTSGTIQWQRTLGGGSDDRGWGIAVDSSGNVYVNGQTNSQGAGNFDFLIAKYDTSGTIQWQRVLGGTGNDYGRGMAVDSSGNVYVVGQTDSQGAGSDDLLVAKYDNSGTIQWQRRLGGVNGDYGYGIAVDSSGNVYVGGYTSSQGAGSSDMLIAKYDTSGTIQWQRVLGGTGNDYGRGIAVDSSGNIYVTGSTTSTGAGSNDMLVAKLPGDGSLTGVYGPFTYAVSTLTSATSTLTAATSTLTAATSTLTAATSTLTDMDIITTTPVE